MAPHPPTGPSEESGSVDVAERTGDRLPAPDRPHYLAWGVVIVGAGSILLLLWAVLFRGPGGPPRMPPHGVPPRVSPHGLPRDARGRARPVAREGHVNREPRGAPPVVAIPHGKERPGRAERLSPAELYKRVSPMVVLINTYDSQRKPSQLGSGFFVSDDGAVATNLHVIQGAEEITVRLHDGATKPVRGVLGFDVASDLAILDVDGAGYGCVRLAAELPEVGTRVYAIGNPRGLENTLSEGIVSALQKLDGVLHIQTTAAISSGSSGGPLLGPDGAVVGVTTASVRRAQNLNFAIPATALKSLLDKKQPPLSLAQLNAIVKTESHEQAPAEETRRDPRQRRN